MKWLKSKADARLAAAEQKYVDLLSENRSLQNQVTALNAALGHLEEAKQIQNRQGIVMVGALLSTLGGKTHLSQTIIEACQNCLFDINIDNVDDGAIISLGEMIPLDDIDDEGCHECGCEGQACD